MSFYDSIIKPLPIFIFVMSILTLVQGYFAIEILNERQAINYKSIKCEVTEVIPYKLEGERIYKLNTYENGSFYILSSKAKQFEQEGVSKRFGKFKKSILKYYTVKKSGLNSIEEINIKGRNYLVYEPFFFDIYKSVAYFNRNIKYAIWGLILGGIFSFFSIKTWNNVPNKVTKVQANKAPSIEFYNFPISKGDLRISRIRDYYVIDVKENFEHHELIKILKNKILKNRLIVNKTILTTKAEYLLVILSVLHNNESHRYDYVAKFYLKNKGSDQIVHLFDNIEKRINEKGMKDYFIQSNNEIIEIISSISSIEYKVLNELE